MITNLRFERFKSFERAELVLGPFTLLVGTNASGKTNIRDAFRFLHGIGRGYTLAEILGEKWIEGGILQWRGIRGGTREAAFDAADTFALGVRFALSNDPVAPEADYRIEVGPGRGGSAPRVIAERLTIDGFGAYIFDTHPEGSPLSPTDGGHLSVRVPKARKSRRPDLSFLGQQPVLSQILSREDVQLTARLPVVDCLSAFTGIRFLDPSPEAMRLPSLPGQTMLTDRGENLSSVLHGICADPVQKRTLLRWVEELTPMDATDFEFPADPTGRVLLTLVEGNGQKISAHSASDGTLRFVALLVALLGGEPAPFYFFEELENGIHPTRLGLLLQLIERRAAEGKTQVVASTHSPQLLSLLDTATLEHASLTFRLPGTPDTRIRRILDIPEARRVIEEQDLARLHASGWLEDAVAFLAAREAA